VEAGGESRCACVLPRQCACGAVTGVSARRRCVIVARISRQATRAAYDINRTEEQAEEEMAASQEEGRGVDSQGNREVCCSVGKE